MATNDNDKIDMFYGFWKHLGVMGIFFTGMAMAWWGIFIMLNDWAGVRAALGPVGNIVLIPFAVGIVLAWMGLAEFLRIIRE